MSDIIHLLPDSVANQIAAGEVIQRPSSVVKELVENSIDAGATSITVIIKDAGRTLVQVIDDGKGMSETDARMAFERHATSKIREANDLFALKTMGFRGEALASIAAVAQVELRTRRHEDELGISISIAGSKVEKQESMALAPGSNFSVKNLFFNVPARRKFLKTNSTELNHIINDFQRIALVYPEIAFTLIHNDCEIHQLPASGYRQRIVNIFGKNFNQQLLEIKTDTELIKVFGFVGNPEHARKKGAQQYFFVNGRFMRHPYFHRAVMQAYDKILPADSSPNYFIFFEVNPDTIDVNIHPTKTEIKFENENAVWPIVSASVREALGKFNVVPSIDFDQEGAIEINFGMKNMPIVEPKPSYDPNYNPFNTPRGSSSSPTPSSSYSRPRPQVGWEDLYSGFENPKEKELLTPSDALEQQLQTFFNEDKESETLLQSSISSRETSKEKTIYSESKTEVNTGYFQFRSRYILTAVKSGLMLIDQRRAHVRVLFEQYIKQIQSQKGISQKTLFPEVLELNPADTAILNEIKQDLYYLGFDLEPFGKNAFAINGVPSTLSNQSAVTLIEQMIDTAKNKGNDVKDDLHHTTALSLAKATAITYGQTLSNEEISSLVDELFACSNPNFSPDGKIIISILNNDDLEKRFK